MSRPGPAAKRPSGWEGRPPPLKLWRTARRPVGFARPYSSREKRSPPRDPRGVPRETIPSTANKGRCRAGRVRLCPLPTFSGRFRYTGRVTAAKQHPSGRLRRCPAGSAYADEERGGFGANKFARNLPRFSCPRNPLSVGLTLALSCRRGLTRTARSARLRRLTSFGGYPTAALCPPSRARRPAVALVVARCAARPRQRDLESAAKDT